MHHISSRLVALMHEVTAGTAQEAASEQLQQQEVEPAFAGRRQVGPPTRRFRPPSSASNASGHGAEDGGSPMAGGGASPDSSQRKLSKSVEVLDMGHRRMSLDDKAVGMAKSNSSEFDVWHGVHRNASAGTIHTAAAAHQAAGQRRGSLGLGHVAHSGSSSGMSDLLNDDERWSWKGSFESALAVGEPKNGSTKRRSVVSNDGPEVFSSVEQISLKQPQQQQHQQHSGGRSSPTASQGSRRSNRSSVSGSVRSNKVAKPESDDDALHIYPPTAQSARFGRRPSIPEEAAPTSAATATLASSAVNRHSTNSLPRLGTSAIQQQKKNAPKPPPEIGESESARAPSNIMTSVAGNSVRSARYRPPGYKPAPVRKVSPSAPPSRKSSTDSVVRYTGRSTLFTCT
jgi:hypothetical protein